MTFDEAIQLLYMPNVSGSWGRRDFYEDRIQKVKETIDLKEIVFTYIKDPFGDADNPSLVLFNSNYLVQVHFTNRKLQMLFLYTKQIEQIIFEDDLNDNLVLELMFKNSQSLKFSSNDGNGRRYSQEIY
jgi:hypothetical protein